VSISCSGIDCDATWLQMLSDDFLRFDSEMHKKIIAAETLSEIRWVLGPLLDTIPGTRVE
jgi:hypothetical protein